MSSQVDVPSASTKGTSISIIEEPTKEELKEAYRLAVASRSVEEHIVRLASRGDVKFAIWGPGEEIHGSATALAFKKVVNPDNFGMVPHYRSGCLVASWCALNGVNDFTERMLRQQFSKATDAMSGGRQMVYHLNIPEANILPVQSAVGMQLGKAAGYALGMKIKGVTDGVAVGIVGDGTTAEGDMHDAMNAASVWDLPVIVMVTDNGVAISTTPDEGRGIVDFEAYARGFGLAHFSCDGGDFWDVYQVTAQAALYCRDNQRACLLHVKDMPRFNGHSSAADMTFDLSQADPIVSFGQHLVERGVLEESEIMKRVEGKGRDFFSHHDLGGIMAAEDEQIRATFTQVRQEPDPEIDSIFDHIYAPFPEHAESEPGEGNTQVTYAGAIRSALDKLISRQEGVVIGQDVGKLGGVMTATAGLQAKHPGRVIDAPLNEPLIMGVSTGLTLHDSLMALPEIQFGDYSLNTYHWLVYAGNVRWSNLGQVSAKMLLRMPTDPFGGGAMYHSMSLDGFFSPIPGLVIIMPSTSFDAHGLMLSAGDYDGPVVCLEPKWMYRQNLGPAFPGEPTDKEGITALKKRIMRGTVPDIPDVYVPFGKGVIRREGADVTLVSWGRAVWTSLTAAETLAKQGISVEVIDLRTIVPPDMELIYESVGRTGRLLVASEDRTFAGFTRQIQGAVVEKFPGMPTRSLGQKNVPGIAQSLILEAATILTAADIESAAKDIVEVEIAGSGGWSFVPPRYFIS
jgi:2-oxoisovalerate dehydrogenase E1 component